MLSTSFWLTYPIPIFSHTRPRRCPSDLSTRRLGPALHLFSPLTGSCIILSSRVLPAPALSREVYVSYPGLDKRLDEWIAESLIVSLVPNPKRRADGQHPTDGLDSSLATPSNSDDPTTQDTSAAHGSCLEKRTDEEQPKAVFKTKTELRHEKERRSLESELSGFRKRKREEVCPSLQLDSLQRMIDILTQGADQNGHSICILRPKAYNARP